MGKVTYQEYLRRLDLTAYLGVDGESWNAIREAALQDYDEGNRDAEHLFTVLIGHPTAKFMEPIRRTFQERGEWPDSWVETELEEEEPGIPLQHAAAFRMYAQIPLDTRRELDRWRPSFTAEGLRILEQLGLVERGMPKDLPESLRRLGIGDVRAVSGELGAGRARSKEDLIGKILSHAGPEAVVAAIEKVKGAVIELVHSPLEELPEAWVRYQRRKAYVLGEFLLAKFWSFERLTKGTAGKLETSADCEAVCREANGAFRWRREATFEEYPPWYPGCGCRLW